MDNGLGFIEAMQPCAARIDRYPITLYTKTNTIQVHLEAAVLKQLLVFLFILQGIFGWVRPVLAAPAGVLNAAYRSGQVFLTWPERADLANEIYRVYRHTAPITADNLSQAQLLAILAEGSSTFYANRRYIPDHGWGYRYLERYVIADDAPMLAAETGLYVHTVTRGGPAYYAVTIVPSGGLEQLDASMAVGPLDVSPADPLPVHTQLHPVAGAHIYMQYMDAARWNTTFHAPNSTNSYYGFSSTNPRFAHTLQYAYEYVVVDPKPENCGGSLPASAPLVMELHGFGFNMYEPYDGYAPSYCAYFIFPYDQSETWWFGFAQGNDYRLHSQPAAGDTIVNYTEQRVLRMVYDLVRDPSSPVAVDANRVYVYGHSMGGSGALALALRYPDVFAAAYASQPMTNIGASTYDGGFFTTNAAFKWGAPALNLPVKLSAPGGWGTALQGSNGTGVWGWQNHQRAVQVRRADAAPFGLAHGKDDTTVDWQTQAVPFYPLLDAASLPWAGAITENEHHNEKFNLLPPTLSIDAAGVPFAGLQSVLNETMPGFAHSTLNPPFPNGILYRFHTGIRWAASWSAWDESPVDTPLRWEMSFCAVDAAVIGALCGTGAAQNVDITPRRLQQFAVVGWHTYHWENRRVLDNNLIASGTINPVQGLLTIPQFAVSAQGNRLIIFPTSEQPAAVFIPLIMR